MPPAPGSSAALRSTYAGYVQELQQSGASMGNRLALHAGRQQMVWHPAERCMHPLPDMRQDRIWASTAQCTIPSQWQCVVHVRVRR